MLNWALYILATAALLWSHYFGLLLVGIQQVIWLGVLLQNGARRGAVPATLLGFAYSLVVLVMQLIPLITFAHKQYTSTVGAAGSPAGTYDGLSFYAVVSNVAWALWGYHPDNITQLLSAAGRCSCCCRCCSSAAAARARR